MIIIVDTRPIQRGSERNIVPMLCKGDPDFLCYCSATSEHLRPWTQERILGIARNLDDPDTDEFANVLGTIAEDVHLIQCDQICSQVQKTTKMSGTIKERSTKSWEIETRNKEEMLQKKMTEERTTEIFQFDSLQERYDNQT